MGLWGEKPGIVQVANIGQLPDGTAYIVMELLTGETLSARMKRAPGGRMPVLDCLRLGKQIASALAAAHAKTIVHRDLKPDNIIIVPDSAVPGGDAGRRDDGHAAVYVARAVQERWRCR